LDLSYKLADICQFGNKRIATKLLDLKSYVSTENLIPNKGGIALAVGLPTTPQTAKFDIGDVLISNIRPYFRKIWFADKVGGCSNDVLVFKVNKNYNKKFLFYVLSDNAFFDYATATSKGTKMPRGDKNAIMEYLVPDFSLSTQKKIADILSTLDDKVELNNKINNNLSQMTQAIFKSWFVNFEPFSNDYFISSELGDIPSKFEIKIIGDIADVIDCLHTKKPERCESGKPLLQLNNISNNGLLDISDIFYISESDYDRWISRCEASPGDCVITNVGRVGAVAQIPEGFKAALGRNMTCVRCKSTYPYPAFLIECLISDSMRFEIINKTDSGTILDALNVRSIPKLRFVCPDTESFISFEKLVRPMWQQMEHNIRENYLLINLRDALLPKLMSGEIDVSQITTPDVNSSYVL